MTSKRLVTMLRELTPTEFSDAVLLMWISNCENTILEDVLLASPEDCVELTELNEEIMLVPHPWDKLYLPYMQAQVAHANGEYDHYANYITLYNAYLAEYTRHIIATVCPSGGAAIKNGYYLSAYAIAVEHGYSGSVEEWLKSLQGKQGPRGLPGPPGPQGEPGEKQFDNASAEKLRSIASNFMGLYGSSMIGVPIFNPDYGIVNAEILRTAEENRDIKLVSSGKVAEMIRKDVTADYTEWVPESGTEKTVENYAKTLPDGKYYIIHGGTVYMDIFTVYEHIKYRFIRRYEDDSCYIELFRGDELTICVEDGASSMMIYGSKMLMDWNIPLPTAADVGKVLMASTVNRAAWTEVTNAEEVAY